jgi:hypothetical protein
MISVAGPREDAYLAWVAGDRNATGGALSAAARELRSKRAATFPDRKEQEIGNNSGNTRSGGGSPGI